MAAGKGKGGGKGAGKGADRPSDMDTTQDAKGAPGSWRGDEVEREEPGKAEAGAERAEGNTPGPERLGAEPVAGSEDEEDVNGRVAREQAEEAERKRQAAADEHARD